MAPRLLVLMTNRPSDGSKAPPPHSGPPSAEGNWTMGRSKVMGSYITLALALVCLSRASQAAFNCGVTSATSFIWKPPRESWAGLTGIGWVGQAVSPGAVEAG